ncbi:MAG: DUF2142 domain-containing protein [Lautropia sp.]|nr:DUF2142 domain-containing protein [Lautropia sp.]
MKQNFSSSAPERVARQRVHVPVSLTVIGCWVALALVLGTLASFFVPPLKSPDEADHLRRAYMLSQGQWLLHTQSCEGENTFCRQNRTMSGGPVDQGLQDYLLRRDYGRVRKESEEVVRSTQALDWTGTEDFGITPGTGYYFPLIYLPQAVGLKLGKLLHFSVEHSYRLVRFLNLLAGVAVVALAVSIHRLPLSVLATLLLPMSLFQAVSASIDLLATALALLALSCFMRLRRVPDQPVAALDPRVVPLFILLCVALFVAITARAHFAPMLLLPLLLAWWERRPVLWVCLGLTVLAVAAWMATALPATVDFRIVRSVSTGEVVRFYLQEPGHLFAVLANTLTDSGRLNFYRNSFLGAFGETFLSRDSYLVLVVLLGVVLVMSLPGWRQMRQDALARAMLIVTGLSAGLLAFLAMLFTWTPHPAQVVEGVQGRYLLIPVILVLMGVVSWQVPGSRVAFGQRLAMVILALVSSVLSIKGVLSAFYHL